MGTKNCAIGDASFSCTGQLTPILEDELPVPVAETSGAADDALPEDTAVAFVNVTCRVVTAMLDTCAAEVAIFSDVSGNLDELLLSAVCAALVSACAAEVARVGAAAVVIRIEPSKLEEDQLSDFEVVARIPSDFREPCVEENP